MTTPQFQTFNRLLGHTITYAFTAQMREDEFCTLIHARRAVQLGNATFEQLREQGDEANIVYFGTEVQELKPKLFGYVRQTLEDQVKRNDTGTQVLQHKDDAARILGLAPNPVPDPTVTLLDVSKNTPQTATAAKTDAEKKTRKRKADTSKDDKPKKKTKLLDDKPSKKLTAIRARAEQEQAQKDVAMDVPPPTDKDFDLNVDF
jgi:hypothetical protein